MFELFQWLKILRQDFALPGAKDHRSMNLTSSAFSQASYGCPPWQTQVMNWSDCTMASWLWVFESRVRRSFTHFHAFSLHHAASNDASSNPSMRCTTKIGRLWCPRSATGDCTMWKKPKPFQLLGFRFAWKRIVNFNRKMLRSIPPLNPYCNPSRIPLLPGKRLIFA